MEISSVHSKISEDFRNPRLTIWLLNILSHKIQNTTTKMQKLILLIFALIYTFKRLAKHIRICPHKSQSQQLTNVISKNILKLSESLLYDWQKRFKTLAIHICEIFANSTEGIVVEHTKFILLTVLRGRMQGGSPYFQLFLFRFSAGFIGPHN